MCIRDRYLQRPRFLALTEFGPLNIVYHEGRKYRVTRTHLRSGDGQFFRAKACKVCGYFHEGAAAQVDLCEHCGTALTAQSAQTLHTLLEMTMSMTYRIERITSEEEERLREGYKIATHFRFSRDQHGLRRVDAETSGDGATPLALVYGPAATILRINHGWRREKEEGYALDLKRGAWLRRGEGNGAAEADPNGPQIKHGVRLVVRDTRNMLLMQPPLEIATNAEAVTSLQYALQRGIEHAFQLETQELSSELLGAGAQTQIMLWEATEGGAGALRRLVEEPDALGRVAAEALRICHVDPESGEEVQAQAGECARACYRCLLSYSNQPVHALLNRRIILNVLLGLTRARIERPGGQLTPEIGALLDQAPNDFTRRVVEYVASSGGRLPDAVAPEVIGFRPHLFWEPYTWVLCPEQGESIDDMRYELSDAGYTVIVLEAAGDIAEQLAPYSFWRG